MSFILNRYIHIKDPLQYTELITRRSVPATICVIWALSALISLLPISLNMHAAEEEEGVEPEQPSSSCVLDFNPSYSIGSSFISFFIPCFIMLFIYFHVYSFARYHMNCIREQNRPLLRLRRLSQDARHHEHVRQGGGGGGGGGGHRGQVTVDEETAELAAAATTAETSFHHNSSSGRITRHHSQRHGSSRQVQSVQYSMIMCVV